LLLDSSVTDWITAMATVFAAIGTVGAVIVALGQTRRQERRSLHVECRLAVASPVEGMAVNLVTLRGTNDGHRPIKVTQAYIQTDRALKIFAVPTPWSDQLPKLLLEGESVEVSWDRDKLEQAKSEQGFSRYLYGFFTDTIDGVYPGAYPGVDRKRVGPPWKRRIEWEPS
jgi:hypothetical protein